MALCADNHQARTRVSWWCTLLLFAAAIARVVPSIVDVNAGQPHILERQDGALVVPDHSQRERGYAVPWELWLR